MIDEKQTIRFQQAIHAFKKGNKPAARRLMREVVIEEPHYAPAWLWMSAFVDDIEQQRECLHRTLELDPENQAAKRGLELLDIQEFVATMPDDKTCDTSEPPQARKLGEYLIQQQIITPQQLEELLKEQKRLYQSFQGTRVLLGDLLLQKNILTPQLLATILVEQQQHKQSDTQHTTYSPEYLGEYLVAKGIITKEQLREVLAAQLHLRQKGRKMLFGELLLRAGFVSSDVLETILEQQLDDIFNRCDTDV